MDTILNIQPKDSGGGGGETRESAVMRIASDMLSKLPPDYIPHEVSVLSTYHSLMFFYCLAKNVVSRNRWQSLGAKYRQFATRCYFYELTNDSRYHPMTAFEHLPFTELFNVSCVILWNVLPSSCFPESYNLPSLKSKINKLDLISLSS